MAGEWLELVSDPGLFTLLLEDFGVRGVQLSEIYDVQQPIDGPVYGILFLFQWSDTSRKRGRPLKNAGTFVRDDDAVRGMFFARQMVPNSCATHALLSVLLNAGARLHLGETLERLKECTRGLDPEAKGWAIGDTPELALAHNSRAVPERDAGPRQSAEDNTKLPANKAYVDCDTFHYVSFVPIGGRLYELDGLKPYPTDHGPWAENEDWTAKFKRIIVDRMAAAADTRCNLMAVVPNKRIDLTRKLEMLMENRDIVFNALEQIMFKTIVTKVDGDRSSDERTEKESSPVAGTSKDFVEAKEPSSGDRSSDERTEKESSPVAGTAKDFIAPKKSNNNVETPVQPSSNDDQQKSRLKANPFTPLLLAHAKSLTRAIDETKGRVQEENQKHVQYEIDSNRRSHDYRPFITAFLAMLAEQRKLPDLIQEGLAAHKEKARAKKQSPLTTMKSNTNKTGSKKGQKKQPQTL